MTDTAQRAAALNDLGRHADAERVAGEGLAETPEDSGLLCELAAALYYQNREDEALRAADAAAALAPDQERGHRLRSLALSWLDRHPEAVAAAERAVELDPTGRYPALAHAQALMRAGELMVAAREGDRVIGLAPEWAQAHYLCGEIADRRLQRRAARAAYTETLRLDPEFGRARSALARLDLIEGRTDKALAGAVNAGQLNPRGSEAKSLVVDALWQLGNRIRVGLLVAAVVGLVSPLGTVVPLLGTALWAWWALRGIPRTAWPVAAAVARTNRSLMVNHVLLAGCLVALLIGAVTRLTGVTVVTLVVLVVLNGIMFVRDAGRR
jgi:tetratricopeptide (TPR) repeat protein